MKAKVKIDISHVVREPKIPEREICASKHLQLDLPISDVDFITALESLVTTHLTSLLEQMCKDVTQEAADYVELMKKQGIQQLELPLKVPEEPHDG